jgi:hypothetical protein
LLASPSSSVTGCDAIVQPELVKPSSTCRLLIRRSSPHTPRRGVVSLPAFFPALIYHIKPRAAPCSPRAHALRDPTRPFRRRRRPTATPPHGIPALPLPQHPAVLSCKRSGWPCRPSSTSPTPSAMTSSPSGSSHTLSPHPSVRGVHEQEQLAPPLL